MEMGVVEGAIDRHSVFQIVLRSLFSLYSVIVHGVYYVRIFFIVVRSLTIADGNIWPTYGITYLSLRMGIDF